MRKCLKVLFMAVLAAALCAGPAQAAGKLDPKFGDSGRAMPGLGWASDAALAPDGSLFVADSHVVARVLPDGRLDPSFGVAGVAPIEAPAERDFRLGDIAVDGSGRPLVVGKAVWPGVEQTPGLLYPAGPPTSAMARRFQVDGAPDPSFAANGLLIADFGITTTYTTADGSLTGPLPIAGIAEARLDSRQRIVLAVTQSGIGRGIPDRGALVARLGHDGAVDTSFGENGVAALGGDATVAGMALDSGGAIALAGSPAFSAQLIVNRLEPNGRPDRGFGPRGWRSYDRGGEALAMAANRYGGIAVLGSDEDLQQTVFRLKPNGAPVRGFGQDGLRLLGARQGDRSQLLLDRRGRVLTLALRKGADDGHGVQAIERLLPSGSVDRGFGRNGELATSFAPFICKQPWALLFRGPQLLTAASGQASPEEGGAANLLLARYDLR